MKRKSIGILLAFGVLVSCSDDNTGPVNKIPTPDGFTLVWSDEFDGDEINSSYWNYETGDGTDYGLPAGWGNNELQIYTNSEENSGITTDGTSSVLHITAKEDGAGGYTSAKMTTKDLISVRYGRVDVRAKLPKGQGIWPAIWLLGENRGIVDWPGCGEIDIVELLGNEPATIYNTIHYTNGEQRKGEEQNVFNLPNEDFNADYHVFTIEWTPEFIKFILDDQLLSQMPIEDDMKEFQRSFYLIMNVAVGGFWPGNPDGTTVFPQPMYVDYVRIYSQDGLQIPTEPPLDIDEETIGQNIEATIALNAIKDGFDDLGTINITAFGGGGEPFIATSATAIDGDSSLVYEFPGGAWGGAYFELTDAADLSSYTFLKFALNMPAELVNAEIKLESDGVADKVVFLKDYIGTPMGDGFVEYQIPLADFAGVELNAVTIPWAMWNPQNSNDEFVEATVLIDNIHFAD